MISKEVIATQQLRPLVEAIFHWQADDPSHCLLRIFVDEQVQQAYVVASEPHSNKLLDKHVSTDFDTLAISISKQYTSLFEKSKIKQVIWIAHFGQFSDVHSFENMHTTESFLTVDLPWPLPTRISSLEGCWTFLSAAAVEELNTKVSLVPVLDVLARMPCDR